MKYEIFKLVGKEKIVPDGYNVSSIITYKLEKVNDHPMQDSYTHIDSAYADIIRNKERLQGLKGAKLVVLPVIEISWDGTIDS